MDTRNAPGSLGSLLIRAICFLAVTFLLACSNPVGVRNGTRITLAISPDTVASGGQLMAVLEIENTSGHEITLVSGASCISYLEVLEAPWGDPVEGTGFYCMDVITDYPFRAGETRTWEWELEARTSSGIPLDPGDYHLLANLAVPELQKPVAVFTVLGGLQ